MKLWKKNKENSNENHHAFFKRDIFMEKEKEKVFYYSNNNFFTRTYIYIYVSESQTSWNQVNASQNVKITSECILGRSTRILSIPLTFVSFSPCEMNTFERSLQSVTTHLSF